MPLHSVEIAELAELEQHILEVFRQITLFAPLVIVCTIVVVVGMCGRIE